MSQETIAHELGVSFATVNRWEHNKTKPRFKAKVDFEKLCKKNGIRFAEQNKNDTE
jgi:DNA-binding transcriptional regulator YiaG